MPAMNMEHDEDPRQRLFADIGDLAEYPVFSSNILVAIYKRPEKTKMGIIITQTTRDEENYQGKVGLVVKKGPLAFKDGDGVDFHGQKVEVGDWVVFRTSDTWSLSINSVPCRMMSDVAVKLMVPSPDKVF